MIDLNLFFGAWSLRLIHLLQIGRQVGIHRLEESIVEPDDLGKGAVVGIQVLECKIVLQILLILQERHIVFGLAIDLRQTHDLFHLTTAETIDGLLAVAHHHAHIAIGQAVVDQGQEVLPLQDGSILKLIHKHMTEMLADAFIYEGNREIAHHCVEQLVELRDVYDFFFIGQGFELHPNLRAEGIQIEQITLRLVKQE